MPFLCWGSVCPAGADLCGGLSHELLGAVVPDGGHRQDPGEVRGLELTVSGAGADGFQGVVFKETQSGRKHVQSFHHFPVGRRD